MMLDRIFKKIGLSRAGSHPMVLGLVGSTMATLVTHALEEATRERVISTLLLALAIPCKRQAGDSRVAISRAVGLGGMNAFPAVRFFAGRGSG